jgi:hypothetical protein
MARFFKSRVIVPAIFIFAGLFFAAIGSGLTYRQRALEKQGIEAQGVVVDLQENYDSDGSTYAPVVQFNTATGQALNSFHLIIPARRLTKWDSQWLWFSRLKTPPTPSSKGMGNCYTLFLCSSADSLP